MGSTEPGSPLPGVQGTDVPGTRRELRAAEPTEPTLWPGHVYPVGTVTPRVGRRCPMGGTPTPRHRRGMSAGSHHLGSPRLSVERQYCPFPPFFQRDLFTLQHSRGYLDAKQAEGALS